MQKNGKKIYGKQKTTNVNIVIENLSMNQNLPTKDIKAIMINYKLMNFGHM